MTDSVRLAKRLAEMVPCSRREAERFIEGGWVTVDGKVVEEPQFRVSTEAIVLHPDAQRDPPEPVTILFHHPHHVIDITNGSDPAAASIRAENHAADDTAGIPVLKRHFSRLSSTLPLEATASGLLVLTQDWRVSRKLVDDAATVEQEYVVEVAEELSPETIKQLNHRQSVDGKPLPVAKVSMQSENRLRVALKGARPGQIAQMCRQAGLQIVSIKRIRIGRVAMSKLLPGQWRYLPPDERF